MWRYKKCQQTFWCYGMFIRAHSVYNILKLFPYPLPLHLFTNCFIYKILFYVFLFLHPVLPNFTFYTLLFIIICSFIFQEETPQTFFEDHGLG